MLILIEFDVWQSFMRDLEQNIKGFCFHLAHIPSPLFFLSQFHPV